MSRALKIISDGIFVLAIGIATAVMVNKFTGWPGIELLAVTSGSMEPEIKTGSIVIVKPQNNYLAGDIVTFKSGPKSTTTHRILFKEWPNGIESSPEFTTAGDANSTVDVTKIRLENISGKVVLSVPLAGYAAGKAKTPEGFILLVIVPGTIIIYEEIKSLMRESKAVWKKSIDPKLILPHRKAWVMLPIIAAVCMITAITGAYLSDKAVIPENVFSVTTTTPDM